MGISSDNDHQGQSRVSIKIQSKAKQNKGSAQSNGARRSEVVSNLRNVPTSTEPNLRQLKNNLINDSDLMKICENLIHRFIQKDVPIDASVYNDLLSLFRQRNSSVERKRSILKVFYEVAYRNNGSETKKLYENGRIVPEVVKLIYPNSPLCSMSVGLLSNLSVESSLYRDHCLFHGSFESIVKCIRVLIDDESLLNGSDDDEIEIEQPALFERLEFYFWALNNLMTHDYPNEDYFQPPNFDRVKGFVEIASIILEHDWKDKNYHEKSYIHALNGLSTIATFYHKQLDSMITDELLSDVCDVIVFNGSTTSAMRFAALNLLYEMRKEIVMREIWSEEDWISDEIFIEALFQMTTSRRNGYKAWAFLRRLFLEHMDYNDETDHENLPRNLYFFFCKSIITANTDSASNQANSSNETERAKSAAKFFRHRLFRKVLMDETMMDLICKSQHFPEYFDEINYADFEKDESIPETLDSSFGLCVGYGDKCWFILNQNRFKRCSICVPFFSN